jgi:hypothetical protein
MKRILATILAAALVFAPSPAWAAIGISEKLSEFDTDDPTLASTGTFSIANGALGVCFVINTASAGNLRTPTLSGGSVATWTEIGTVGFNSIAAPTRRITAFRGVGTGAAAAAVTAAFAGSTQTSVAWNCYEVTGADSGGTNGSEAIAQFKEEASDSATETSPTFTNALTATAGIIHVGSTNADRNWTIEGAFTSGTVLNWTGPTSDAIGQFDAATTDDTPALSISGVATAIASLAVEVTEDSGAGGGGGGTCRGILLLGAGCN